MFNLKEWFFGKKKEPILSSENIEELKNIKRDAYMEEARTIVKENGKIEAQKELKKYQEVKNNG